MNSRTVAILSYFQKYFSSTPSSSLAKGFTHGPPSLHPWQIELDFVVPADRHLAVFTSPIFKDDITFDQWALLTDSCLRMSPLFTFSTAFTWCFRDPLLAGIDWTQLVVAAFNRNRERVDPKFQFNQPRVKRGGTVSETLG